MKKLLRGFLIILCSTTAQAVDHYNNDGGTNIKYSQSFMFTHPIYQNVPAWQATWHNFIYEKQGQLRSSFQMYGMYQQSVQDERTIQYFFPPCRLELLVAGDDVPSNELRDIRAEWLGIDNPNFRGRFTINPRQKQMALIVEYNQDLKPLIKLPFFENSWLSIFAPINVVENDLELQQFDVNSIGTQEPQDILAALDQPAWRYGKLRRGTHAKLGLSEIRIRFGQAYLAKDEFEVVYYSGVSLPTSGGQNAAFLFNPFLGNNARFGFITGVNFQLALNKDNSWYSSCLFLNFESNFFIRGDEYRTIDLKYKPWSRYVQLNRQNGPPDQNIPAVNILTQKVCVRPFNHVDFSTGFRLITCKGEFEVGYGIWGHPDERIEIKNCFEEIYGIAGVGPLNPTAPVLTASSASQSTIAYQAPNDTDREGNPIFIPIKFTDLDLKSAAARAALNQRIHCTIGFYNLGEHIDSFLNMGFWGEFPQKNSSLTLWGFWGKIGASF